MFKKREKTEPYDRERLRPVIRVSICTGEQVAGFKDIRTGKFEEVMLIAGEEDYQYFLRHYEVDTADLVKEY